MDVFTHGSTWMLLLMAINMDVVTHDGCGDLSSNNLLMWIVLSFY